MYLIQIQIKQQLFWSPQRCFFLLLHVLVFDWVDRWWAGLWRLCTIFIAPSAYLPNNKHANQAIQQPRTQSYVGFNASWRADELN